MLHKTVIYKYKIVLFNTEVSEKTLYASPLVCQNILFKHFKRTVLKIIKKHFRFYIRIINKQV